MATKRNISPEVRAYFQEIGRKRGNALKEKHGSAYFSRIAKMRKTYGRQKKDETVPAVETPTAENTVDNEQA